MMIAIEEKAKSGYVATLYAEDQKKDSYWLEVSYGDERVLFYVKVRDENQLSELLKTFSGIKINTLEKLLDLKKVKGFSAGRLIRYINAGHRMDTCFAFCSASLIATICIEVLIGFIYTANNKISLMIVAGIVGTILCVLFFYLYRVYRGRLKYDR